MSFNPSSVTQVKSDSVQVMTQENVSAPTTPGREIEIPSATQSISTAVSVQNTSEVNSIKENMTIEQEKTIQEQNKTEKSFGQKFVRGLKKVGKGFVIAGKCLASIPLGIGRALAWPGIKFTLLGGAGGLSCLSILSNSPETTGGKFVKWVSCPLWGGAGLVCGAVFGVGFVLSKASELAGKAWNALWPKKIDS